MSKISLVISDVDGTLVTSGKVLTERSIAAVARLHAAGIGFSVITSRPPFGLHSLIGPLRLRLPIGVYNGGALVTPDLTVLEQWLLSHDVVRDTLAVFRSFAVGAWAYAGDAWMAQDPHGAYVDLETRTLGVSPTIVADFATHLDGIAKIVGVTDDPARLMACEPALRQALKDRASVVRSQPYYLDVTAAGTNKGVAVSHIARRLGIPSAEIATLGDMENDISMFQQSGFSIAMGNAKPEVKSAATAVTLSNDEDGFSAAVDGLILPRKSALSGGG